MANDLTPTDGARFLLERTAEHATSATYACTIATPDASFALTATLSDDGTVALEGEAPEEQRAMLEMFAKLTARGAAKRRDDGLVVWPARILRWRS